MRLRSDYKDAFVEKHGVKLGLMSGFVKVSLQLGVSKYAFHYLLPFDLSSDMQAAVSGLQNQPIINAVIDGEDIIYREYVDISIAVGTKKVCDI